MTEEKSFHDQCRDVMAAMKWKAKGDISAALAEISDNEADIKRWNKIIESAVAGNAREGGSQNAYGVYVGSSTSIFNHTDESYTASEQRDLMAALKATGRIVQLGAGYGKGFILVDASALPEETLTAAQESLDTDPATTRLMVDIKDLKERLDKAKDAEKDKNAEIATLQREVEDLKEQLAFKERTTWS